MKSDRIRIDVDVLTKQVIDDLIERGFFGNQQAVLAAAIAALQVQLANDTMSDEYFNENTQTEMDSLQLGERV